MIRTYLSERERHNLKLLRQFEEVDTKVRDRATALLLSSDGWSPPRIADFLGWHAHTVRSLLKAYNARGGPALELSRHGPSPDLLRRFRIFAALDQLLSQEGKQTSRQLSLALRSKGYRIGPRQVRRYLAEMRTNRLWLDVINRVRLKELQLDEETFAMLNQVLHLEEGVRNP